MRKIKSLLIMLICLSMILTNTSLPIKIFAEENIDETDAMSFETLETQILNSERWCGAADGDLSINLNVEKMWFLDAEDIVVSYSISNGEEITNVNYSSTGFNVIDVYVDSNDYSKINIELLCLDNQDEYKLDLNVTVGEENVNTSLYAINNQYGIFISEISTTNAYERYLEYTVTENIVTLEEAEEMWYEYLSIDAEFVSEEDVIHNLDSEVASISSGSGTVCGELKWKDTAGREHPLRGIKVEIYYDLFGAGILLNTTVTNGSGCFSAEIDAHNNVYIRIYAGDDNVKVGSGIFGWRYWIEDTARHNISAGETVNISIPTITMVNDEGLTGEEKTKRLEIKQAFQIAQAAIAARDYAKDMMGRNVADVTIIYPSLPTIGSCYIPVLSCIALDKYDYSDWDVIMHEYGHHIEFLLNIMLDPIGEHHSDVNHADAIGVEKGTRLAWGEAWNTVFALMAQDYLISQGKLDNNINAPYVGDTKYTDDRSGYDLELSAHSSWAAKTLGDACEQSIMAILWNLYDSNNDLTFDNITISHNDWWELTTESGTYRFSDRANRFYELYADQPEKIASFAKLLTYYKMAPSSPVVSNTASVSISVPPSMSWSAEGGSVIYPNNSFDVIVYDALYNEIVRVENLGVTSYTFDSDNWNQALKNHGYACNDTIDVYITVAGSRVESQWFDNSFKTGPYFSEYLSLSITPKHNYIIEQYNSQYHKLICNGCDGEETMLAHNFEYIDFTATNHTKTCADCGYTLTESHDLTHSEKDDSSHTSECAECGYSGEFDHDLRFKFCVDWRYHAYKCVDCGYVDEDSLEAHSYNYWAYLNPTTHISECTCGARGTTTAPHAFVAPDIFSLERVCVGCGYTKIAGSDIGQIILSIQKVSLNGSYILPDGNIVLVDEDVEAYLNGTLVFYDKDNLPVTQ